MSFSFHRLGRRYNDQFTDHFSSSGYTNFRNLFIEKPAYLSLFFVMGEVCFHLFVRTNMDKTNTVPSIFPGNCRTILAKVKGGKKNELVIVDTEDGNCSLL